jgi:glutamate synthase (NADPH/NADH) small chain
MKESGITFKCNTFVGRDIAVNNLITQFDAIVLAGGSTVPRDLKIVGREARGVYFAMEFLKDQNENVSNRTERSIDVYGKKVIVIGGGDTGSDCIGTSVRQHAASITQLELMPPPPPSRTSNMPWPTYPMILKTTSSHEEGCHREWAIATKEFLKDENGNLCGLKVVNLDWSVGSNGNASSFVELAGSEKIIDCDFVFLAMGFERPEHSHIIEPLAIQTDQRGNIEADSYRTNINKVFTAGDMRRGQSLVVWAINEGRECAKNVNEYLLDKKQ